MEGRAPMRRVSVFLIFCLFVAGEVVSQNGNSSMVNVGALFTFDSYIGRSLGPAIHAAVQDVNSDSTILKDKKINLIIQDTNCSGFAGTVEGISFFLFEQIFVSLCLSELNISLLDRFV